MCVARFLEKKRVKSIVVVSVHSFAICKCDTRQHICFAKKVKIRGLNLDLIRHE